MPSLTAITATGPSVTDWIGALSTAVLGVLGLGVTLWQVWASGFRIKPSCRIDRRHEAIELRVINRGRGSGIVERVVVETLRNSGAWASVPSEIDGFPAGQFLPVALPGSSAMNLIIKAKDSIPFDSQIRVWAFWGNDKSTHVSPQDTSVSLFPLSSTLPPSGRFGPSRQRPQADAKELTE